MRKRVRLSSSYSKKREVNSLFVFFISRFDLIRVCVVFYGNSFCCNQLGGKRDTSSPIEVEEDRISQLPDEVLVSILSLLTIREAARTSVLSHRWVKLWTCFNGSLTFDLRRSPFGLRTELRYHEIDRSNYIDWVNQVLASLDDSSSSTTLVDFTVRFDSDKDSRSHIDRWIQFALEKKKLQKIELDMQPRGSHVTEAFMRYTFSLDFYTRIKQPRGLYTISTLSSLCLKYVDVTEELIEFFLSNCPLLERLCVVASEQLLNLKVTGVKLPLKYLEVYLCFNLESLEISAPNLLAFKYFGPRIKLHVENVPRLLDVSIGREDITYMVGSLSNYFSQLETLRLDIMLEKQRKFKTCLNLNKLKHLTLKVEAQFDVSILGWTSLIKAAPFLHTFTLELIMFCPRFRRQLPKVIESPHQCLKVVELVGFVGCSTDIGLAMYLLANASALEKIIIDRRFPLICGGRLDFDETKETKAAKRRALGLKRKLRKGVELVIV